MKQQYIILYEYYSWTEGCGCCSDSSSEVHVFKKENVDKCYESCFTVPLMENEQELRDYIHYVDKYWDGFEIHPDTVWF